MTTLPPHPILEHLRKAVQLFANHGPKEMSDYITSPSFRDALTTLRQEEGATTLYKKSSAILHLLEHTTLPEAKPYIQPLMQQVADTLSGNARTGTLVRDAHDILLTGLADIDLLRNAQAQAFTAGEAARFAEKGPLGYAVDLAKRRWKADGNILPTASEPAAEAAHSGANTLFKTNQSHVCGAGCAHHHAPTPKGTIAADALKNPKALEEYGKVGLLETPTQKLVMAAGSAVGLGLVIHGGSNVIAGARGERDASLEPQEAREEHAAHHNGMNISRLVVGLAEMTAGAALIYRMLTGRLNMRQPVSGKANAILSGCSHGHGIGI